MPERRAPSLRPEPKIPLCARRGPHARNLWQILGKRSWGDALPDRDPDLGKRLEPAIEYAERRPGSWAGMWI